MKQGIFEQLKRELCACWFCEGKFDHELYATFRGAQDANIMQTSQAPSIHVRNSGLPFHDASGKKLRRERYQTDDVQSCDEHNFYIASMGHCYLGEEKRGDKKPPKTCVRTWLTYELDAVDNQLYIIAGAMAARELFPERSSEELVSHDQQLRGKPALVLPHPSSLNVRWMKEHPQFEADRLLHIRRLIHRALQL